MSNVTSAEVLNVIHRRIAPLTLLLCGVLLGAVFANMVHPHPVAAQSMGSMSQMHGSTADAQMMAAINTMNMQMRKMKLTGNTDRDFMQMMIPHHQAAIDMAKVELRYGKSVQVKELARKIIAAQRKEITEMKGWLPQAF